MGAIAGIYTNFKVIGGMGQNLLGGMLSQYIGCASDELSYSFASSFQTNTYISTDGTAGQFWSTGYQNIYDINACLTGIATTNAVTDSTKQALLGELKVLRAMNYFYLVNLYGGVPVVTTIDYKVNNIIARSSVDSVYNFIIKDLKDARSVLKAKYPSAGRARPNLYTADALLARTYLYHGQYADAEAMVNEVTNSGLYSLVDVNNVFLQGSNEAIWQIPAVGTSNQTTEATNFVPSSIYSVPNWQATNYLLDSMETNDLRKASWVGVWTVNKVNYNYVNKYKQRLYTATPVEGYVMLRDAEQYLIRAEARAMQNNLSQALDDINIVRKRAGLPNSRAVNQNDILNAIMHERQIEFFCEWGHRWFDLKRTGRVDAVISKIKTGWVPTAALLPVPNSEIQNDPFLTQNPGY